jgi:hypothetical protein
VATACGVFALGVGGFDTVAVVGVGVLTSGMVGLAGAGELKSVGLGLGGTVAARLAGEAGDVAVEAGWAGRAGSLRCWGAGVMGGRLGVGITTVIRPRTTASTVLFGVGCGGGVAASTRALPPHPARRVIASRVVSANHRRSPSTSRWGWSRSRRDAERDAGGQGFGAGDPIAVRLKDESPLAGVTVEHFSDR